MTRHYCTYFDQNYLAKGLTLYESLVQHARPFVLWVLCFDDTTYRELKALNRPDLKPVALAELERYDPDLAATRNNRSLVEYYFTCSPVFPLYLLKTISEIDIITYLDGDLWFFADPAPLFEELGDHSILIVEHRFPEKLQHLAEYGKYNVGILCFRNDQNGLAGLEWWRARCLEWCYDHLEGDKYADQKYLDDWPERFEHVVVLQHKGINLAPWNWMNYQFDFNQAGITVDEQPLICFHFHRLKQLNRWLFDPQDDLYKPIPLKLRWRLYLPYARALNKTSASLYRRSGLKGTKTAGIRQKNYSWKRFVKCLLTGRIVISLGGKSL